MSDLHLLPTTEEFRYVTEILSPLAWHNSAEEARFCMVCRARLSRYNSGDTCWHHNLQPIELMYGAKCSRFNDCFTCPGKDCTAQVDSRKNHQYGQRNESIRRLCSAGQPVGDIANLFGLGSTAIRYIVARGNGRKMRLSP